MDIEVLHVHDFAFRHGEYQIQARGACLYDTVSETVFGPLFDSTTDAEVFLEWLDGQAIAEDARAMTAARLGHLVRQWEKVRDAEEADHAG